MKRPRLVFVANSMYSPTLSGGDIHTLNMADAALRAGFPVHFLAGNALNAEIQRRNLAVSVTLTDSGIMPPCDFSALSGQLRLLADYVRRLRGTMAHLDQIQPDDVLYANTDFWWDAAPVVRAKAKRKLMILGMDAPTFREIAARSRPDVKAIRLPSIHYWLSQQAALRSFRRVPDKRLLYVHPNQHARLLRFGYAERELAYVSNGFDLGQLSQVPDQPRRYDAVWTGRIHHQKGIDDLLATLAFLCKQWPDFRGLLIGNVKEALQPRLAAMGIEDKVDLAGFVPESEKFRLLKSSRVYLMPSRYESWGIVIAEAIASGTKVVAYDLDAYRPVFGDLVRYAPCFDLDAFQQAAAEEIRRCRAGERPYSPARLSTFLEENSWQAAGQRFVDAVESMLSPAV